MPERNALIRPYHLNWTDHDGRKVEKSFCTISERSECIQHVLWTSWALEVKDGDGEWGKLDG